jgi:hypothetical protein
LTSFEIENINNNITKTKTEEFINNKILKMFREFVNLGADYNAKIKKTGTSRNIENSIQMNNNNNNKPKALTKLIKAEKTIKINNTEENNETAEFDDKYDLYFDNTKRRWNILMLICSKFSLKNAI